MYDCMNRTAQNTTIHAHKHYYAFLALHTRLHCIHTLHLRAQQPPISPKAPFLALPPGVFC